MEDAAVLGTLTSGVQDISALLPLLGTEQCENHAGSALKNGYIYAAATPMSLFGSLGLARAGLKAFIASVSIPRLHLCGAQWLADAGFTSQSTNLPLIMMKGDDRARYRAEADLDDLVGKMDIEVNRLTVSKKCWQWNFRMAILTAFLSALGLMPYVHLILRGQSTLPQIVQWIFPAIRVFGGFLVATTIQIVTQSRVVKIVKDRLLIKVLQPTLERPEMMEMEPPSLDGNFSESYLLALRSWVARTLNNLPSTNDPSRRPDHHSREGKRPHSGDGVREAEEGIAHGSSQNGEYVDY
jgi:hypothetical protein